MIINNYALHGIRYTHCERADLHLAGFLLIYFYLLLHF